MALLKKPAKTPTQQESKAPEKKKGGDDFAKLFNSTEKAARGTYVPPNPGRYQAFVTSGEIEEDDEKRTISCFIETTIVEDPYMGKTCRSYFNLAKRNDDDSLEADSGMPYFRAAMELFGYSGDIEGMQDVAEFLKEIAEQRVWVLIEVKRNGKYTNVYINEIFDNQENKPDVTF